MKSRPLHAQLRRFDQGNGPHFLGITVLAEKIGINASSLSEQIDRLEADHYLERKANPADRRSTLILLTEKGKARAYELSDERQKAAAAFCAKLTEEEKDTLIQLLDKLLETEPCAPCPIRG